MPSCSGCANFVPDGYRFCPTCGAPVPLDTAAQSAGRRPQPQPDETVLPTSSPRSPSLSTPAARAITDDGGHYTAGTLLAGRYRIVGLLGKGGMGEVYRADDLTLGQPVALKFIPRDLANVGGRGRGRVSAVDRFAEALRWRSGALRPEA